MRKKSRCTWTLVIEKIEKIFSFLPNNIFVMLTNPIISFPLTHQEEQDVLDETKEKS